MIIREYESTGTLKPDDKGYQAFETAGRRIGPLYNQMAGDVEKAAKDVGQLWEGTVKFAGQELAFLAEEARRLPPNKIVGGKGGGGGSRGADTSSLARYNARNEIGRGGRDLSSLARGVVNADTENGVQVFRGGDFGRPSSTPKEKDHSVNQSEQGGGGADKIMGPNGPDAPGVKGVDRSSIDSDGNPKVGNTEIGVPPLQLTDKIIGQENTDLAPGFGTQAGLPSNPDTTGSSDGQYESGQSMVNNTPDTTGRAIWRFITNPAADMSADYVPPQE